MSAVPHSGEDTEPVPEERATPERRIHGVANSAMAHMRAATAGALAASREASTKAAELQREARGTKSLSASPAWPTRPQTGRNGDCFGGRCE